MKKHALLIAAAVATLAASPAFAQSVPMTVLSPADVQEALGKATPFPPRLGRPEEYAALVQHVVENEMLNGETIRLDGAVRLAAR